MKRAALIGIILLLMLWLWLAWLLLSTAGISLKNLIILAMSAIIVFVPLFRKFNAYKQNNGK